MVGVILGFPTDSSPMVVVFVDCQFDERFVCGEWEQKVSQQQISQFDWFMSETCDEESRLEKPLGLVIYSRTSV